MCCARAWCIDVLCTSLMHRCVVHEPDASMCWYDTQVLTVVQLLRSCVERARRDRGNVLACLVQCVLNCVFALVEFLSK